MSNGGPYPAVQRNALKAALVFAGLGVALGGYGVLRFVGVVHTSRVYGTVFCFCGALCLWLVGRVLWGVRRERVRGE